MDIPQFAQCGFQCHQLAGVPLVPQDFSNRSGPPEIIGAFRVPKLTFGPQRPLMLGWRRDTILIQPFGYFRGGESLCIPVEHPLYHRGRLRIGNPSPFVLRGFEITIDRISRYTLAPLGVQPLGRFGFLG